MIKHVITMDKDDFNTLIGAIGAITYEVDHMEESHRKDRLKRYLEEIDELINIEPPPIPEAAIPYSATWRTCHDLQRRFTIGYCSCCNNREEVSFDERLPTICPHCKAVMTGVE